MEFRLLGELQVCAAGRVLDVGLPRQQAVLAVLAVDVGRPVPASTLVDRVWGDSPPVEARNVLYSHLSRIRRLLTEAAAAGEAPMRVQRRAAGYLLNVDPEAVDLHRFGRLIARARDPSCADTEQVAVLGEALGLWRGTPLAGIPGDWAAGVRDRCGQQRLDAAIRWAQAVLRAGDPDPVLSVLPDLVAEYPLAEPLAGLLMRALAAAGRDAEALDRYATTRARLVEELGAEPGPELRAVHEAVLRGEVARAAHDPPSASAGVAVGVGRPVPAQLPADVSGFTGRDTELRQLDDLLTAAADKPSDRPSAVVISAVSGTAGVGKTALAIHWAHRVRETFPDGQLHVNLRGYDPGGRIMDAATAVRGFLDALGVPPERVPADLDAQAALYRSLLDGRRVLVVIDNARDAEHARPLLPGTGAALAVVTSRSLLTDLVAVAGAHPLALDMLTEAEARELLERRLGPGRVAAEPDAARRIVGVCARLPLALALVAARAATHPNFPLAAVAAELADAAGRTAPLGDSDDVIGRVRAVFSWSYTTLTPAAARLFRLLGLHPGPDITAPAATSLAGLPLAQVRRLLVELVRAGLLGEHEPGRYGFHDLLAAYATHLTHTHDPHQTRQTATSRLLDHHVHTAYAADRLLDPPRDPPALRLAPTTPGTIPEHPADHTEAMAWLSNEYKCLLTALGHTYDAAFDSRIWQLTWALDTFLDRQGHWHDLAAAWQTALTAARRLGNPSAQAYAHRLLAQANTRLGRYRDADTHLRQALDLYAQAGDRAGQGHTHLDLSWVHERQSRPDQSLAHDHRALELFRAAGHRRGQANALNGIGWDHAKLGHHTEALTYCRQAVTLHQQLGNRWGEADTWDSLGYAHHHLDHYTQAADCYQHALALYRDLGDRYQQAAILTRLGDTYHAAGHPDQARAAWTTALDILTDLNHPDAEDVRAKLATVDHPSDPG